MQWLTFLACLPPPPPPPDPPPAVAPGAAYGLPAAPLYCVLSAIRASMCGCRAALSAFAFLSSRISSPFCDGVGGGGGRKSGVTKRAGNPDQDVVFNLNGSGFDWDWVTLWDLLQEVEMIVADDTRHCFILGKYCVFARSRAQGQIWYIPKRGLSAERGKSKEKYSMGTKA